MENRRRIVQEKNRKRRKKSTHGPLSVGSTVCAPNLFSRNGKGKDKIRCGGERKRDWRVMKAPWLLIELLKT